jgi:hypothetical protein
LLIVTFYFLREGITIDALKAGRFDVEGLYLKLDKKLILKIDRLVLPSVRDRNDTVQIETLIDRVKLLPRFFRYIELDNVEYARRQSRVLYHDDVIYLSTRDYEIAGMIERNGSRIEATVPLLHIKKYDIKFHGKISYDYRREKAEGAGRYTFAGFEGNVSARYADGTTHFRLDADGNASIEPMLAYVKLPANVRTWLTRRIRAKRLRIDRLEGDVVLEAGRLKPDWRHLKGHGTVYDGSVAFHPKLERAVAQSADITLKNNVIYAAFDRPMYRRHPLAGTTLYLTNVFGKLTRKLHLDLRVQAPYDRTIAHVLGTYGITIPLEQKSGRLESRIVLDFPLVKKPKVAFKGEATVAQGGTIMLGKLPVRVDKGRVTFDPRKATLIDVHAKTDWLDLRVNGPIVYPKRSASLKADVFRLALGEKQTPFFVLKNKYKVPVHLKWNPKKTTIDIPLYRTTITLAHSGGFDVTCTDAAKILPFMRGLPIRVHGGHINVHSPDGKRYTFSGKTRWPSSYLYTKKGPIRTLPFSGSYDGRYLSMTLLDGRLRYQGKNNLLRLHHLNIDAKKMMDQTVQGASGTGRRLRVKGEQSLIRYDKYVLMTDRFDFRTTGKNTTFIATKDGDNVHIERNGNMLVVKANRIKAPMLRSLIHFGGLQGGRYSLDLRGNINQTLRGVITIQGGVVSSFKTYNNMIALFNTVPALASFSNPGFSNKGFEVRNGRIEFRIVKKRIYFDMIFIDGKSAAISGKGTVSTINGAINMDLAVRTARGIGKLIGSLPVVGYILMGKDKSITTGVKITGTLENPKVETHVVLETLLTPFKMMVRTLKSPAHIINK